MHDSQTKLKRFFIAWACTSFNSDGDCFGPIEANVGYRVEVIDSSTQEDQLISLTLGGGQTGAILTVIWKDTHHNVEKAKVRFRIIFLQ